VRLGRKEPKWGQKGFDETGWGRRLEIATSVQSAHDRVWRLISKGMGLVGWCEWEGEGTKAGMHKDERGTLK